MIHDMKNVIFVKIIKDVSNPFEDYTLLYIRTLLMFSDIMSCEIQMKLPGCMSTPKTWGK